MVNDLMARLLAGFSPEQQRFLERELETAIGGEAGGNLTGRDILERLKRSVAAPESKKTRELEPIGWFVHEPTSTNPG